jgi:nucleotide-binding universal stress UspA family protein
MKNILIATDFSPAARDAERYAVELARALDCGLNLLSVYSQVPVTVSNSLTSVSVLDKDRITRNRLDNEAAALDVTGLSALTLLRREGPRVETILAIAGELEAGLIITGMKSSGKGTRRVFGSTITGLMHHSQVPVLVIPEGFHYYPPAAIAMGNDFIHDGQMPTPAVLRRIVDTFDPKRFVYKHLAQGNVSQGINDFIDHHGN